MTQPKTTKETILQRLVEWANAITYVEVDNEVYDNETLNGLLQDIKAYLSEPEQTQPSIWKKYPEKKPNTKGHDRVYIVIYTDRGFRTISYFKALQGFNRDFREKVEYWAYETELRGAIPQPKTKEV